MDQGHSRARICAADRAIHGRKMSGSKTPWNVLRHRFALNVQPIFAAGHFSA